MERRLQERLRGILDTPPKRYKPLWAVILFWVGVGLVVGALTAYGVLQKGAKQSQDMRLSGRVIGGEELRKGKE